MDLANLTAADKWILCKFNDVAKDVTDNMEKFELGIAVQKVYDFIWEEFCDWYIEMVKPRLYNDGDTTKAAALWALKTVLGGALKLLHPYMPFIDGSYKLGVNDVIVENGDAKLPNGVRAGSTLTMAQALRNLMAFTGEGAETVSRLMTANPARLMGWAGKGELDVGKDADLVLLDGDYQVARTVVGGRTVYTR